MGMMDNINTYGELCAEIERVEKAIEDVRHQIGYEQGDEIDLQLYLIDLKETKKRNEYRYKLQHKFGVYTCEKCGSIHLKLDYMEDIKSKSYVVGVTCEDCNHKATRVIPKSKIKECIPTRLNIWGSYEY